MVLMGRKIPTFPHPKDSHAKSVRGGFVCSHLLVDEGRSSLLLPSCFCCSIELPVQRARDSLLPVGEKVLCRLKIVPMLSRNAELVK